MTWFTAGVGLFSVLLQSVFVLFWFWRRTGGRCGKHERYCSPPPRYGEEALTQPVFGFAFSWFILGLEQLAGTDTDTALVVLILLLKSLEWLVFLVAGVVCGWYFHRRICLQGLQPGINKQIPISLRRFYVWDEGKCTLTALAPIPNSRHYWSMQSNLWSYFHVSRKNESCLSWRHPATYESSDQGAATYQASNQAKLS